MSRDLNISKKDLTTFLVNICDILPIYRFKMVHTFEQHKNKLDELCRLCGNKSLTQVEKKKNRKKLLCADYTADILLVFNIFVQRDSESKHPKHRFGLGLLGEQGGELLHSTIGKIQKRTHAMKDEASQLKTTMQLHLLQTSQQVQSLIPTKRRKKSNKKHC